jgi:DNA-binding transcriptional regulator YiaG
MNIHSEAKAKELVNKTIKAIRKESWFGKMSQGDLAGMIGSDKTLISHYERNVANPPAHVFIRILQIGIKYNNLRYVLNLLKNILRG